MIETSAPVRSQGCLAGVPVGSIAPGEIVGEMAFLLRQPRAFDVDATATA